MANRQKTYRLDGPVRVLLGCNYKELIMLFFGAVGGYLSVSKFTENAENAVAAISLMIFAILGGLGLAYSLILGLRFLYERMPDKFVSHLRSWYTPARRLPAYTRSACQTY